MIRRVFRVLLIILLCGVFLKACLVKDVPPKTISSNIKNEKVNINEYPSPKTVTVGGVDYMQSQAPVGKFGGELVSSTFGEGPKTFNYFNSKDASSSTLSGIMFDGLLSTDPVTGQPVPKLAKSFEIRPDGVTYIINMRRGIKWSDGKPITAEDVV